MVNYFSLVLYLSIYLLYSKIVYLNSELLLLVDCYCLGEDGTGYYGDGLPLH